MDIKIDSIGGNCPVQADGTIDGFPFYFRARGEHWALNIACGDDRDPVSVSCGFVEGWRYEESYGDGPFAAGYMSNDEAIMFINKAARLFQEKDEKSRQK